jgi:hypothetical protein
MGNNGQKRRQTRSKVQDLEPPPDTPIPRRSPRRPANPPTTVSNQKRVLLKFDDSLLAKKGVDDDTAVLSSKKARGVTSETSTVCKDTPAPEPSTQNFEQILSLIESTPEIEQILRKKYRPVMHSTPPGGESRALFLHLDKYNGFHKSPEPDSISVSSSDGPPSGSNDIEPQDESDGDEPMDVSDGVSLYSSKARSKPRSDNGKPLGRARFRLAGRSEKEKQQIQCLFAAVRMDYVAAGPPPACLEGNGNVVDDQPLLELFQRRYTYIFGPTAPKMDKLLQAAVHLHITF